MDQVTQQNAAMVEETTAAAHMLNEESDEAARLVSRFQIGRMESEGIRAERKVSRQAPVIRAA